MIMTSASRGVPLITSAPNLATSYLGVMLVAISTKQHERPKWNGHIEFFRPHCTRPCTVVSITLCCTDSSKEPVPLTALTGSTDLLNHHFISFCAFPLYVCTPPVFSFHQDQNRVLRSSIRR